MELNEAQRSSNDKSLGVDKSEKIEFKIPAKEGYASLLRIVTSAICLRQNCTYDLLEDIKLAVDEAFMVAIKQKSDRSKGINVSFRTLNNGLLVEFPFNELNTDSMSIFLIRKLMDEVSVEEENGVILLKMKKITSL